VIAIWCIVNDVPVVVVVGDWVSFGCMLMIVSSFVGVIMVVIMVVIVVFIVVFIVMAKVMMAYVRTVYVIWVNLDMGSVGWV